MSITAAIKRHLRAQRLFALDMLDASHPIRRSLFLSSEVKDFLDGPWSAEDAQKRAMRLQADLESFVKGEPISMCLVPSKAGTANFGRLAEPSEEIWDYRSRTPAPVMRIFGRFAKPDTFIAFSWSPRTKPWNGRPGLGGRDDPRWEQMKEGCRRQWNLLFPHHEPIHGDDVHDYVTENVTDILSI